MMSCDLCNASLSPCVWILPCLFITYWKLCGPVEGRHHPQGRGRRGRQEHPGKPGRRRESTRKTRKTDRLMSTVIFLHVKVEVTDQNIPWIGMLGVRCSLFMSRNSGHGSRNLWDLFSSSHVLMTLTSNLAFFPKQFTVGVLNSILKCVRLVSGAVSASGRFVFQFICLPIHLSPRSCVRGCVRLRGICLPIHLSPNSFVSQVLCQGLCPPPGDLSPNSFVRLVSGAVSASERFVSQFICLPGPCLPIHLSPRSCGRGCVRLRGIGFPIHLSPNSFVSQVLCQGLCPPSGDLSPNSFVFHHSPNSLLLGYSILS